MNATDFIYELLMELGEHALAEKVASKLEGNEDAFLTLRFERAGKAREIHVNYHSITVEME